MELVGVTSAHDFKEGADDDPEIEAQTPIVDIPEVTFDPVSNFLFRRGRPAIAINLRPTGQSWFDVVAKCIIAKEFGKIIVMRQGVRPRSDE